MRLFLEWLTSADSGEGAETRLLINRAEGRERAQRREWMSVPSLTEGLWDPLQVLGAQ